MAAVRADFERKREKEGTIEKRGIGGGRTEKGLREKGSEERREQRKGSWIAKESSSVRKIRGVEYWGL